MDKFYDEESHKYFVDGEEKPSVTEIAKPISEERLNALQMHLLNRARERGTRCHELFEQFLLLGELEESDIEEEYIPYVNQFILWARTYRPKVLFTEKQLFGYDFCGTTDLICVVDGKTIIVDYKTSSAVDKKSLSVQLEGYYRLCRDYGMDIDDVYYLHIRKDGYTFKPIKRDVLWFDLLLVHNKKMKGKYNND